jgi:hypothetical protein
VADDTRSPLKDNALRNPGQSCEERRRELFDSKLELPIVAASASVVLAGLEFWRSYANTPPAPWIYASFALITVAFLALRIRKYLPEMRNLKLGAEGEKAVGQYLERLRSQGYEIFHDIPASGFNVDHVIIGPTGVYAIETKTWRKPKRGDSRITFDGATLLKGGFALDRDPVVQARAQATWLVRVLAEGTGRTYFVKPVVLFPGWFVENTKGTFDQVWVLEPKALPGFLEREPHRLEADQVRLASYHLSRYIRTSGQGGAIGL